MFFSPLAFPQSPGTSGYVWLFYCTRWILAGFLSDLAQVLALGHHQFAGTERVPGLVPWVRSYIAWGKAVRGSIGFYTVTNPSITVSLFWRIVFIFYTATTLKARIRPTIGNYISPGCGTRVPSPWMSPACRHRFPEAFQRCVISQYRRSRAWFPFYPRHFRALNPLTLPSVSPDQTETRVVACPIFPTYSLQ